MKRIFTFILGFFVFTLSVSDVLVETLEHSNSAIVESCESASDGQDHCPQGCSPFHICCTSLGFTAAFAYSVSKFIPALKNVFSISYLSPETNSFMGDIWQPPKF
jgi:hypothetical protein